MSSSSVINCVFELSTLEIHIVVLVIQNKWVVLPLDFKEKEMHLQKSHNFIFFVVFKMDLLLQTDTCHGFK